MEIFLMRETKDSDLYKDLKVCYKDQAEIFSKLGIITDIIEIDGIKNYLLNTAFGAYTANELKLIK